MGNRSLRFDDSELQEAFLRELRQAGVSPELDAHGAVVYSPSEAARVIPAASRVRDSLFSWYLIKPQDAAESARLQALFSESELRYRVEHHENGDWLLVPRAEKEHHERLFEIL